MWSKKKKPLIIIHGDIIYDIRYLKNIIKSKKKDLIGISSKKINVNKKKNNWVVKTNKKKQILKVDYIKNFKNYSGEIIGINKISTETANKIFKFMKFFLKKKMKKKSWEYVINKFIEKYPKELCALFNQNYNWININTIQDYYTAKKQFQKL